MNFDFGSTITVSLIGFKILLKKLNPGLRLRTRKYRYIFYIYSLLSEFFCEMGIKEIAKQAGVSIGTVDRVLHDRGRVSAETRQKIVDIIKLHEYRPNLLARSLKKMKKITIALLVPKPTEDEYWQQAWDGFESQLMKAEQHGIFVKPYFYSLKSQKLFCKYSEQILEERPDGLIMAPNYLDEGKFLFRQCTKASIPVVMFDVMLPGTNPFSFIGTNSCQSGRLAAQLLSMISSRRGKFAIFHFDELLNNSPHMIEKEQGFIDYLKETSGNRGYLCFCINSRKKFENQLERIFNDNPISGIFVSTSKTYMVGYFLKKRKIQNVKLVGFDLIKKNIELLQEGYIDFLINQNPRRQAIHSLDKFIDYLVFKQTGDKEPLSPIEVITRENLVSYL